MSKQSNNQANYVSMTPALEYQNLVQERDSASKEALLSGEMVKEINKESLKSFDDYYNKILFYSASAFSFTLALVNLVAQQGSVVALQKVSFLFPNVYWLYLSWLFYVAACGLIILSKKIHALYLGSFAMGQYAEKVKNLRNAEAKLLSHELATVISVTGDQNAVQNLSENAKSIEKQEQKNKKDEELQYRIKRFCGLLAELFAFIATVLLLLASIAVTQTFIWV